MTSGGMLGVGGDGMVGAANEPALPACVCVCIRDVFSSSESPMTSGGMLGVGGDGMKWAANEPNFSHCVCLYL